MFGWWPLVKNQVTVPGLLAGIRQPGASVSPTARARFGCYYSHRKNSVPSESTIRNVLIRINPVELDQALQAWNAQYGVIDESLAIDGKTMRNAIDDDGRQIHIMGAVGHQSKQSYTQKKSAVCR